MDKLKLDRTVACNINHIINDVSQTYYMTVKIKKNTAVYIIKVISKLKVDAYQMLPKHCTKFLFTMFLYATLLPKKYK